MFKDKLQNLINGYYSEYPIGAIAVGVTNRENPIAFYCLGEERYGESGSVVTENTLFRIASISKVVTGLTAYKLIDDKLIDADENVATYLPFLPWKNGNMTMKKLLSHTAGLPVEYTPDGPRDEGLLEKSLIDELSKIDLENIREDSDYLYSNVGIRLASLVMEKVTGERFTALARKYVIEPLKMASTTYFLEEALNKRLCYPCDLNDGRLCIHEEMWENAVRYAAGGLFSNLTDLCNLARFILNGKGDDGKIIVSKESLSIIKSKIAGDTKNTKDHYGQAMMIKERENSSLVGHLGSAPPYATAMFTDSESGYGVVVLMNTYHAKLRMEITEEIFKLLRK